MKPWAYYNEIEPAAAHVLRALIAANVIAPGEVDERSIIDVRPDDLRGFSQCHFFAGGGLWSVAARLAGWPDERPLWTGSCPCQPFSVAGKGRGADDPRHLWPDFFRLIRTCRPPVVVGEQVAGAAGYGWFDGVSADLEGEGYASRAVDIPACAVDAPHIRQRLYWVADALRSERRSSTEGRRNVADGADTGRDEATSRSAFRGPAHPDGRRRECTPAYTGAGERELADAQHARSSCARGESQPESAFDQSCHLDRKEGRSFWMDADLRLGADGKARRVGSDFCVLVDGFPAFLAAGGLGSVVEFQAETLTYANAYEISPGQIVRALWEAVQSQPTAFWGLGEWAGVSAPEILLPYLRQYSHVSGAAGAISESEEIAAWSMRGMWSYPLLARASLRWESSEQFARQHPDALHALSRVLAQCAGKAWAAYRRENAAPIQLLTSGAVNRVAALRIGGNAIVPQVAVEVLRALVDAG